jgi:O-antigen ligase
MMPPGAVGALAVAAALLMPILWLSWRKPTWLFVLALAALAIRPQLLWGGPAIGYGWGLHQTFLVFALAVNALRFGVRRTPNWPILAQLATFGLGLAFGDLHPKLSLPLMLMSLAILALPFAFTQVVLEPGSRRACALVIMLTPLLSVALGGLLDVAGFGPLFGDHYRRLQGATGNAAVFAALAFAGFAVALHESTRPGRPYATYLALLNLALVILSGTRMAMFASMMFLAAYFAISPDLREQWQRRWGLVLTAGCVIAVVLALYWPIFQQRMFTGEGADLRLSQRDELWSFYYREFLLSPLFGRGFGAGFIAGEEWVTAPLTTPHNEYLHLLVIGGLAGAFLCAAAIVLWYRVLLGAVSPNDRGYVLALAPAVLALAITDNPLLYSSALAIYASLGILLTRPSPVASALEDAWPPVVCGSTPARREAGS